VKENCTMRQLKAAAADYVKLDAAVENREHFGSPTVFVSENTMVPLEESKDTAKVKTVCSHPTASGIVFVPAPSETPPQYQPHASHTHATVPPDVLAMFETFQKASESKLEAFREDLRKDSNLKLDALQQRVAVVEEDNEDLREQVEKLTEEGENKDRQIAELKTQTVVLQGRIAMVERGYEDIHGWLSDKDTEYMDRIRLRHILDCGQARLARLANVPPSVDFLPQSAGEWSRAWRARLAQCADNAERLATARSLLANCDDTDTRDMSDDVLRHFTVRPNDARTEGDRTAHPANVGESVYKAVIERQPEDQRPLLRLVVAYGLQFRL